MREGLQLGAGNYPIKPVSLSELIVSINLRLRHPEEFGQARCVKLDSARPYSLVSKAGMKL